MSVLNSAIGFIIGFIFNLYIYVLLLRFLMQKNRVSWHNPIIQGVIKITEPVVNPVRKLITGFKGFDLAILVISFVLEIIAAWILTALKFEVIPRFLAILIIGFAGIGIKIVNLYFYACIVAAIMSWLPALRFTPVGEIAFALAEPLFRWLRKYIPPIKGMDLSALFVFIALLLVNILIFNPLLNVASRMLLS
jgi:YggT family protein